MADKGDQFEHVSHGSYSEDEDEDDEDKENEDEEDKDEEDEFNASVASGSVGSGPYILRIFFLSHTSQLIPHVSSISGLPTPLLLSRLAQVKLLSTCAS